MDIRRLTRRCSPLLVLSFIIANAFSVALAASEVSLTDNVAGIVLSAECPALSNVSFSPSSINNQPEGSIHEVQLIVYLNETAVQSNVFLEGINVTLTAGDEKTLKITSDTPLILHRSTRNGDERPCYFGNFTVELLRLGRSNVDVKVTIDNDGTSCFYTYPVTVIRALRTVDTVFNIGLVVMLVINNIGFGCKFDMDVAKSTFKKPIPLVIGFVCQYGLMPLLAFAIGKALSLSTAMAFGLMTSGSAPGGGQSNVWTIMLDGDITLSICMTLVSSFASLGVMPLWLLTLGRYVLQNDNIYIPFLQIFLSLLVLVIPLAAGLLTRRFLPKVADFICKLVKPTAVVFILYLLTLGVYSNLYAIKYMFSEWKVLVAALILPWGGSLISAVVALALQQRWTRSKTIAIETAYQNSAIALIVLRNSLVQPEADLTSVMPIAVTVTTPIPFVVALIIKVIVHLIRGKKDPNEADSKTVVNGVAPAADYETSDKVPMTETLTLKF